MKKTKVLITLSLIIMLMGVCFSNVHAHTVELDPNDYISFPTLTYGGEGTIYISSSQTGYSLYYQAVEMSKSAYDEYEKIAADGEEELNQIMEQKNQLENELAELEIPLKEAEEAYKQKVESGATDLEPEESAYDTALTNYNNKVAEINSKVELYNNKVKEIQTNMNKKVPTYVESNWIKTEDRKFSYDTSWFSNEKVISMWAKLITSEGNTHYDQVIYILEGTKVDVKSVSLDKTTLDLVVDETYTFTATINPSTATNKTVEWTSSNENIVKVVEGKVTALSVGTAKITVKTIDGNYTASCDVNVTAKEVTPTPEPTPQPTPTPTPTPEPEKDNTTASEKIPQTGIEVTIGIVMISIMIIGTIGYIKYKKLSDI